MFLLSLLFLLNVLDVFSRDFRVASGGVLLLTMDPFYFFAITHLGLSALRQPRNLASVIRENGFLCAFLVMLAVYVLAYTPTYGQSALGEARKYYFPFLIPLVVLTVIKKPEDLRRLTQLVVFTASVVAAGALGLALETFSLVRVLNSEGTFILALAALTMLLHRIHKLVVFTPRLDRSLLVLFSAITVASGQRSVWLAVGFGLLTLALLYHGRPEILVKLSIVLVVSMVISGFAIASFPKAQEQLATFFAGILDPSSDGNATWRMESWRQQLGRLQNTELFFGTGIGNYYSWRWHGYEITVAPHNAYVQTILKFGLFGLFIYLLLALQFFHNTMAARKKLGPGPMRAWVEIGIINFAAAQGFMLGYGFEAITFIYFALALSTARLSERFWKAKRPAVGFPYKVGRRAQRTQASNSIAGRLERTA